ncbi:SusC/RagA family TonB-linked outer membrane protein [Bacteroides sp. f07]|uniref:SusC/RagA family TonB-linked outer membrane protein n=1 Tax=Bacteroides sp. f07 TaxID=3132704 RepID=UPI0036F2B176
MNGQKRNLFRMFLAGVLMLLSFTAYAQERTVTGKVYDAAGEPIIGASVVIQGTTQGTITDIDGAFQLKVQPSQTLVVSFLGYKDVILPVGNKNDFKVTLEEDSKKLDEVVVVGYATQKKVNLTGSVASVSSKDIQDIPVANTATLLQGRLPGLVLTQNGAQAGNDNPEIRIRGIGTFGNNNPMVLIDGVEGSLSQISEIPSADIDNISVLKDAASAAIYGVRAANGVILITTKRGQASSRVKVSYSGSYTLQTPGIVPDYVDSYNWALMRNEVNPDTFSPEALQRLKDGSDPDHYANTNWLDAVLRNASMHQHHLSVSGGSENTHFMTSVAYSNQEGIMMKTGVERFSFRSNLDTRYKRFTFGLNLSGNKNNVTAPAVAPSGEGGIMRFVSWFTRPTVPVMYSNGHYGYVDGSSMSAEMVKNPVELMSLGHRSNEYWRFNGKAFAGIELWDGLKFQTSLAYAFDLNATKSYTPKSPARYDADGNIVKAAGETNKEEDYWYRNATWTNENLLTYNKQFNKHNINVLLGHSVIGSRFYKTTASIQGFPTENIYELKGGTINPGATGESEEYKLQSFFGRVNYSYDDRYLFEFNIRHDGSSRMPKANRYATFPSLSAGWVFSNEGFMKDYRNFSLGKLRLSWGKLGNQEIGNYAYAATLGASGNYFFDQSKDKQAGMVQTSVPNENIKWETTRSVNVALDLGFFNNRIQTTFEWFDKKTSDILMQLAMPGIFLGSLSAPYQNVGAVRNRGWEWTVNYSDSKGDWAWNVGFNLSHVKNEILEMGELEEKIDGNTINRIGNPIGAYFGYKAIGIYRTEADLQRTNSKGEVIKQNGVAPKLGDIMYADLDDNGNITPEDRDIIGNPFPKYSYSFNLGASWKNFDLSTFWQGVGGIYRYSWETSTDIRGNLTNRWVNRYSADNINAPMPALGNTMNDSYSSFWLEKSNYLRLKNLEFGYTFRQTELAKVGISSIRVYFAGSNLLTFTPLKNWDPEKSSGDTRNDVHPNMRTYSFGLNIQF